MFKWLKVPFTWLSKNLSSSGTSSNSRALQSIIVLNLVVMLWIVLAHGAYKIDDNTRLVMLTLITSGAGGYALGKFADKGEPQ